MSAWSSAVVATTPYLYWRLGEASGSSAADSSGNGRNGTYASVTYGAASLVPSDAADNAITIDNANDQVSHSSVSFSSIDFTAMAVVKGSGVSGGLFASSTTDYLNLSANIAGRVNNNSVALTPSYALTSLFDGTAHLVMWIVKSTSAELWVDGVMVASGTHSISSSTRTTFQLKRASSGPSTGTYDELTLWNRGLTSTEIATLYAAFTGGAGPTTVTGGQAAETDTAQGGSATVGAVVAGGTAAETDAAQAGSTTAGAVVAGGQASETDTGEGGSVATGQVASGGQASETDTAQAGSTTVGAVVSGGQGSETDTGQGGSTATDSVVVGGQAGETDTAQAGSVPTSPIDLTTYIDLLDTTVYEAGALRAAAAGGTARYAFDLVADPADTYSVEIDYTAPAPLDDYASTVMADSPIAYYRLGEPNTDPLPDEQPTMYDSSGVATDGYYVYGAVQGWPGLVEQDADTAVAFNGSGGFANVDDAPWMDLVDTAVSVEAIVTINPEAGTRTIAGTGFWALRVFDSQVYFTVSTNPTFGDVFYDVGYDSFGPYHLLGTFDGTTVSLYVDGVLVGSNPVTGDFAASHTVEQHFRVGLSWGEDIVNSFSGTIDEVAVYDHALSAERAAAHALASGRSADYEGVGRIRLELAASPNDAGAGATQVIADSGPLTGSGTWTPTVGPGLSNWDAAVAAGRVFVTYRAENAAVSRILYDPELSSGPGVFTDTTNAANALVLGGWAVATWEPAVVPRPLVFGQQSLYAVAYGDPVMSGTMPTYPMSEASKPRWRQRILIGGRDATYERGVPTPDVEYQLADPLLYGPARIALPQISATREWGKPWLSWLRKGKRVKVQLVDDNDVVQATVYKGFLMAPNISGADLALQAGGEAQGRAIMRDKQVPVFRDVLDLKRILWRAFSDLGLRFLPRLGEPGTGIRSLNFGGTGMVEHIEEVLARATKRDGTQRTVMPDSDGVYRLVDKDTETVHWTLFLDEVVTTADLNSDMAEEPNRVYATTINPDGMRVNFAAVPGIVQGPTPDYPMAGDVNFGIGTTNEDTIDGDGISVMINRLGAVGLLDIRDTPGGYDEDVADAVHRLRLKAGLASGFFDLLGVMTPNVWDALWDLDVTGTDKSWSSIQPAAQDPSVERYKRSANGGVMGLSDDYDADVIPVDLTVDMGSGFTGNQAERFAEHLVHDPDTNSWYGTITSRGGAVLIGQVDEGATLTPEMLADGRLVRPAENLWVPNFDGGTLFHIAAIDVKASDIRYTVDTRARPARDVWERIRVRKETRRNPIRGWLGTRQSNTQKDAVQGYLSFGGMIDRNVHLEPGWNIIEVILGDYGTIAWLQTVVQTIGGEGEEIIITPHEYALGLFGKHVTAAKLNDILPSPLAENGDRPWRRGTSRTYLHSRWDLYSAGTFEEPCGYGVDLKTDDATLTGEHIDEGGFPYKTEDGVTGYLAVWVESEATLMRGRIMWPLLEGGV